MANESKIHPHDIEDLAAHICGFSIDNYLYHDVDNKLQELFSIDLYNFIELVKKLDSLLFMGVSPLTESPYIGFGTANLWIAKKDFPQFINQVIVWLEGDELKKEDIKGYERIITLGGRPKYKIVIMKADTNYSINKKEGTNG